VPVIAQNWREHNPCKKLANAISQVCLAACAMPYASAVIVIVNQK
jgi:hypothetical protein